MLVCGWGPIQFMTDVLGCLDVELPPGSEVTLFNQRTSADVVGRLAGNGRLGGHPPHKNLSVLHVEGNPLSRAELAALVDVSRHALPPSSHSFCSLLGV